MDLELIIRIEEENEARERELKQFVRSMLVGVNVVIIILTVAFITYLIFN